jgi:hypothetical protein
MKYSIVYLFAFSLATGCATSSGVLKMGPDTYKMSATHSLVRGGADGAQSDVLNTADEFCQSKGKEVLVQSTSYPNAKSFAAIFQCLDPKDSDLKRPHYEQAPTVVIKNETQ